MSEKSASLNVGRPKGSYAYTFLGMDKVENLGQKTVRVREKWWRELRSEFNPTGKRGRPAGSQDGYPVTMDILKGWVGPKAQIPVHANWLDSLSEEKEESAK